MKTMEKLQDVMRVAFVTDQISLSRKTTALDVDGWDSLSHTILMLEIEIAFKIEMDPEVAVGLANVGSLVDYIDKLVSDQGGVG